ncbi:Cys-Gln thioester bond-forming surface protein [Kitasatospora sp. NBC_00315]|uniref:Cys-Gln thioester bond-forming surface protein n=1 Tax=Kitasatospora sp. NBC_00315 TaxID=2975963 RepID=UPI00324D0024
MLTSTLVVGGSLLGTGSATAADGAGAGVTAVLQPTMESEEISVEPGRTEEGGLFTLKTADGTIQTYCIDIDHGVRLDKSVEYQEADWKSSSLGGAAKADAAAKIRWILENSYPKVTDLTALAKTVGADKLSKQDAAAGTQAAIWHFSDGKTHATPKNANAAKLTAYLVGDTNKGIAAEPKPSLTIAPEAVAGKTGDKLGPFTLNSSADEVKLSVSGDTAGKAALVDKDGKPVGALKGPIAKDTQFFLAVPADAADGSATVSASASTVVPTGRVFLSKGYTTESHSQTMILAGSSKLNVTDTAKATWTKAKGAILAATSEVDCAQGGVEVTVTNTGDQPATVTVQPGTSVTVQPGKSGKALVPVAEDTAYDIKVSGPNGFAQEFKGVLDCKVTSVTTPSASPSATASASVPAGTKATASASATPGGGLAATGGSSATPVLAGVAGALVLAGGAAVFVLRRRGRHSGNAA